MPSGLNIFVKNIKYDIFIHVFSLWFSTSRRIFLEIHLASRRPDPPASQRKSNVSAIKTWYLTATWAGLLAAGWVGCKSPAPAQLPAPPSRFELRAQAAPGINRDAAGNPLSVVVHLYQLKDRTAFSRLSFDQAASGRPEAELLGGDCLGRTELVMVPGGLHASTEDLLPGARYLGIVALFRHPDPHCWRYLVNLDQMLPARAGLGRKARRPAAVQPTPRLAFKVLECSLALPELKPEPIPGQPEKGVPDCLRGASAGDAPAGPRP
jgi:type VI secretion system protein VasD